MFAELMVGAVVAAIEDSLDRADQLNDGDNNLPQTGPGPGTQDHHTEDPSQRDFNGCSAVPPSLHTTGGEDGSVYGFVGSSNPVMESVCMNFFEIYKNLLIPPIPADLERGCNSENRIGPSALQHL
jgi:hypothetical protein